MSILSVEIVESLATHPQTPLAWTLEGAAGIVMRHGTSPIAQLPNAQLVRLILPASVVMLTRVKVPAGRSQKLRQMLRYAVEDKVMADPETLHVASATANVLGVAVAVLDHPWLTAVIAAFRAHGVIPRTAVVETLLPQLRPSAWTAVWDGRQGFVRTAEYDGLTFDGGSAEEPPLALRLKSEEARVTANAPSELWLFTRGGSQIPDLAAWSSALGMNVRHAGAWSALTDASDTGPEFNLLQGEFAPASFRADWLPKLRPAAILAAAIIVIQLGASSLDWLMLSQEKTQLQQAMTAQYKATFPESRAVVDAPRQMQSRLQELRGAAGELSSADLVPMIARMTPQLDRSVRVALMDFSPGLLKLDLILPAAGMAESVRTQLQSGGLAVELQSIKTAGNGATARYILRSPAL